MEKDLRKFTVIVTNTIGEEWEVFATTFDEAEEKFQEGKLVNKKTIIYEVETVEEIIKGEK